MSDKTTRFTIKTNFPVSAQKIYQAWLNGTQHTKMTGGQATGTAETGSEFTAWDGYISGRNVDLIANKKIVQTWRTIEFDEKEDDSQIEIILNDMDNGCEFILTHTQIPSGQPDYEQGWQEHYFEPMKEYFK